MGRDEGLTDQKIQDLGAFETSSAYDDLERLSLRYAVEMTKTPVDVPEELFRELEKRLEPKQLVELTSCIAWENYRARFDHAFGIESQGFSEGAVCAIPAAASSSA